MASGATEVYGAEITLLRATPARLPSSNIFGGQTRLGTYEASALAVGAWIHMIRCQDGEVVLGGRLYWDALGASTQATVGTYDDTDRFMTVVSTVAASGIQANDGSGFFNQIDGIGYEFTTETDVLVAMADAAATGTVKLVVHVGRPGQG